MKNAMVLMALAFAPMAMGANWLTCEGKGGEHGQLTYKVLVGQTIGRRYTDFYLNITEGTKTIFNRRLSATLVPSGESFSMVATVENRLPLDGQKRDVELVFTQSPEEVSKSGTVEATLDEVIYTSLKKDGDRHPIAAMECTVQR